MKLELVDDIGVLALRICIPSDEPKTRKELEHMASRWTDLAPHVLKGSLKIVTTKEKVNG